MNLFEIELRWIRSCLNRTVEILANGEQRNCAPVLKRTHTAHIVHWTRQSSRVQHRRVVIQVLKRLRLLHNSGRNHSNSHFKKVIQSCVFHCSFSCTISEIKISIKNWHENRQNHQSALCYHLFGYKVSKWSNSYNKKSTIWIIWITYKACYFGLRAYGRFYEKASKTLMFVLVSHFCQWNQNN